jgi:hypothetical protein
VLGARLGVRDDVHTVAELRDWLVSVRGLRVTREARAAARFLVIPPLPVRVMPAYSVIAGAAIGLVPLRRRVELGLPPVVVTEPLVVRPAARTLLGGLRWALGESPTLRHARARCAA